MIAFTAEQEAALRHISQIMSFWEITAADIRQAPEPVRPALPPKYRHPQTGETWSGRGKAPRWLAAEEAAGATRDSFLIKE